MQVAEQETITGEDLRHLRETAGASIAQVARAWPCTSSNVQLVESSAQVTPARAAHYREALARVDVVEAAIAVRKAAAAVGAIL